MENTVVGVYDSNSQAQSAMDELIAAGFDRSKIQLSPELNAAIGQTTRPQGERDTGSAIGNFFRSLFGTDDTESDRDMYAEAVRRGSMVLTVTAVSEAELDRAAEIMSRHNPVDIDERSSAWRSEGWSRYDAAAPMLTDDEITQERSKYAQRTQNLQGTKDTQARIPVVQEELKVGKRAVQRGGVRVFQRVVETPVSESVRLREEHVNVERRAVDKPASEADLAAFKEGEVEMREMAEEPVIEKTARVVEEVVVGKEVSDRTERIEDTVRSTDVDVQQMGADDDADYRRHWQTAYASMGGRYEDYDSAYRYGAQLGGTDRYRNAKWADVEPDVRRDWESRNPGSTWEKTKDAIRYGMERVGTAARSVTGTGATAASTRTSATGATTADASDDYRRHWQTAYGTSGGRYEDYDAAYRYGHDLSGSGRFQNYRWDDIEPNARRDWESSHPETTWDKVKDAVRYGAERVKGTPRR